MTAYPVTLTATERGVSIETSRQSVSMGRFSERAARLLADLGTGTHVIGSDADWQALSPETQADVLGALS